MTYIEIPMQLFECHIYVIYYFVFGRGGEVYITDVALTEFGILGEDIYIHDSSVKQAMLGRSILEKNAGNEELPIIDISAVTCNF